MGIIAEKQLNEQIKSKRYSPVYFIFGDDHFLIKNAVDKIIKNTVTDFPEFNFNYFKIGSSVADVCSAAQSMPLMSQFKCVSVCDIEIDKLSSLDFDRILALCSEPNQSTVLVFWFETVVINQKKQSDRIKKVLKAVEDCGGIAACINHRTTGELSTVLRKAAQKRGCELEISTANYIIETCGADLFALTNEIVKLCFYCENRKITRDDVDAVCSKTVEASIYNLSKFIISKDIKKSLNILYDLLFMNVAPLSIIYNLASAFIDMSRAKAAVNAGKKAESIAKDFGYPANVTFRLANAERSVKYLSDKQIRVSLDKILDCEMRLKGSSADGKVLIEKLIVELVLTLQKGD